MRVERGAVIDQPPDGIVVSEKRRQMEWSPSIAAAKHAGVIIALNGHAEGGNIA